MQCYLYTNDPHLYRVQVLDEGEGINIVSVLQTHTHTNQAMNEGGG